MRALKATNRNKRKQRIAIAMAIAHKSQAKLTSLRRRVAGGGSKSNMRCGVVRLYSAILNIYAVQLQ